MGLRFLGEEFDLVPREQVLATLRLLLDEPKLAYLVIADLARWEDWSVLDRLVTIFKQAQPANIFVREPIVNYLRACPLPEAAAAVEELRAIDPEAVRRAATLAGLAGIAAGAPPPAGDGPLADSALAGALEPVQGDENPTALREPAATEVTPVPPPTASAPTGWKWAIWAAVVIAVALVARQALRPAGAAPR